MVESMSVEELRERLTGADGTVQVVDVRHPPAFRRGHLPGAVNVPLAALPDRVAAVDWDEEVVCVCPKGESSLRAARLLEAYEGLADTTVYNLTAGLQAWDGPVETPAADGRDGADGDEGPEAPF